MLAQHDEDGAHQPGRLQGREEELLLEVNVAAQAVQRRPQRFRIGSAVQAGQIRLNPAINLPVLTFQRTAQRIRLHVPPLPMHVRCRVPAPIRLCLFGPAGATDGAGLLAVAAAVA